MPFVNIYFSENQDLGAEVDALCRMFGLNRDEIGSLHSEKGKRIYISNYEFMSGDFAHILMLDIDDTLLTPYSGPEKDGDGVDYSMYDFPRRLSKAIGKILVGEALDWDNNCSVHRKFYPDGMEEDIETPDDE